MSYQFEMRMAKSTIHKEGMAKDGFKGSVIQILQNTSESNGHALKETSEKLLEFLGLGNQEEFLATPDANGYRSKSTKMSDQVEVKILADYPNPAVDHPYINYLLPDGWKNASLNVYDPTGKLMISENATSITGIHEIETSKIHSGIYSIELVVDGIKIATEKLVVLH